MHWADALVDSKEREQYKLQKGFVGLCCFAYIERKKIGCKAFIVVWIKHDGKWATEWIGQSEWKHIDLNMVCGCQHAENGKL